MKLTFAVTRGGFGTKRTPPHLCDLLAQERKPEVWKRVRTAYKGVREADKLATELPDSQLGVLLLMYIKQVRTGASSVWPRPLGILGVRCEHGQRWQATMPA